jgi:hypothetical protein
MIGPFGRTNACMPARTSASAGKDDQTNATRKGRALLCSLE